MMNQARMCAMILFALALFYPLSIGPVLRYGHFDRKPIPAALRTFYTPLGWVAENIPGVDQFFDWYAKLWAPPPLMVK